MNYLALAALIISGLGMLGAYFGFFERGRSRRKESSGRLSDRIACLEGVCGERGKMVDMIPEIKQQVDRIAYRLELQDKIMTEHAANIIHSPLHTRRDKLVDKLLANRLSPAEQTALAEALKALLHEENKADKKLAAALLLARVEWEMAKTGRPEGPCSNPGE